MKEDKTEEDDWLRPEYQRSDLGKIERGKYARRIGDSANIEILDPQVTRVFPTPPPTGKT
jgi:hypothetical protein